MKVSAIITSAGKSNRMKRAFQTEKPYILLKQKPILAHTLSAFDKIDWINEIILVVGNQHVDRAPKEIIKRYKLKKVNVVTAGGRTRTDSVRNGLAAVSPDADIILIHDGARPFVTKKTITDCIKTARKFGAAIAAVPATSTIKTASNTDFVKSTPDRKTLWEVQTPQAFRKDLILTAHKEARKKRIAATDDSCLVERLKRKVKIVMGSYDNIKITTPIDLKIAEAILNARRHRV